MAAAAVGRTTVGWVEMSRTGVGSAVVSRAVIVGAAAGGGSIGEVAVDICAAEVGLLV